MAGDGDGQEPPSGGAGDDDEGSLPEDAKRLLRHMGRVTREQMNSVLDERLRVEQPPAGGKDGGGDGAGAGDGGSDGHQEAPGRSLAEKLGFGGR